MLANFWLRALHWGAVRNGAIGTALLALLIVVGSRNLQDFDWALAGYAFASLFAVFGIIYRYSVWLTKPPTRKYWRRGWELLWQGKSTALVLLSRAIVSRLVLQNFILRRGTVRYIAHMLILSGCALAAAVTFPLVFGWLHFEQGALGPDPTYEVVFFGMKVQEIPLQGVFSWAIFHALIISSFLVIPGVAIALFRRMTDHGEIAIQRFTQDLMPLILLFAIAFSGLLLWVSYEFLDGYFYSVLAQFHAITVIGTLLYMPFGKLFHIFQRPASIGVALYKALNAAKEQAVCPVTHQPFAPKMQTEDLKGVLSELRFDYSPDQPGRCHWNEISPKGRRLLIGAAHSRVRKGAFD
ncbi:MAG: hypothetical protein A2X94_10380 [Bdellovibrionales bacterium GWB1_55_8]|nr:MAG: hypothetical protein A2X94_10380 [Bdellovibrionales bacterium GWB1_55_8]